MVFPGVPGAALATDLPVLTGEARSLLQGRIGSNHPGWMNFRLRAWHGWVLAGYVVIMTAIAEAQAAASLYPGPIETLMKWIPFLLWHNGNGFMLNLIMSFLAMAIGTVAGVFLGLLRVSLLAPVRHSSWLVTQFFRNSPWLVLLFCVMLTMPFEINAYGFTIRIPDWSKAVLGFSLPIMANIAEVVRGAIQSVPIGQWESAESLAFTRRQTLTMIILPQCIKRMIPPWMNWYAILTMSTSVASVLGVQESVTLAQQAMVAENSRPELLGPFYGFLLLVFFIYCYPIARWTQRLEKKYAVKI
jgi:polar amino acid transport system permease protein